MQGWDECDRAKLGQQEAGAVELALRERNLAECRGGRVGCDYSVLSSSESATLAAAERLRNYTACLQGRGYCDRARLTPREVAAIGPQPVPGPVGRQP